MADGEGDEKVVVSGFVRQSTKGVLLEEVARRDEMLRAALGDAAPKVSLASVISEVLENWRSEKEAAASVASPQREG